MSKKTHDFKTFDLYVIALGTETEYENISEFDFQANGVLKFRDDKGTVNWLSSATEWHLIERGI